jgi:hypothetical protein
MDGQHKTAWYERRDCMCVRGESLEWWYVRVHFGSSSRGKGEKLVRGGGGWFKHDSPIF